MSTSIYTDIPIPMSMSTNTPMVMQNIATSTIIDMPTSIYISTHTGAIHMSTTMITKDSTGPMSTIIQAMIRESTIIAIRRLEKNK
ncbi:MAG: hypothetical protein ABSC57_03560 [Syntrophales bacterium]|jgi:hypothetical protein